jgi:hypothetical protein
MDSTVYKGPGANLNKVVQKVISYHLPILNYPFLKSMMLSHRQRRHLFRWLSSINKDYLFSTPAPWMPFDVIEFLGEQLRIGTHVFEYGSGGSTLFWVSRGAICVLI